MTAIYISPDTIKSGDLFIPSTSANADYRELIASGVTIKPWVEPPPLNKTRMSFSQLAYGAAVDGYITEAEFYAWLKGNTPTALTKYIALLPTAALRMAATAAATRPEDVIITHQIVQAMAVTMKISPEALQTFFNTYGYA